tara:strand:- start:911 stop:2437 length:1527 start_codon:yes stop_codon:yes gene_type:complete
MLSTIALVFIFFRQLLNYFYQVLMSQISENIHKVINIKMFNSIMRSSQSFIIDLNPGKFINATDIEPGMVALMVKSFFTFYTNILTMITYSLILLFTSFIPTIIGLCFLLTLLFFTGGRLAIFTKKVSEKNVSLRALYRDLITERFLGWKTVKIFNTLEKETIKLNRVREDILYNTVSITKVSGRTQLFFVIVAFSSILIAINIFIEFLGFDSTKILIFGVAFMRLTPTFKVFQLNLNRLIELLPSYIFCENILKNANKSSISDKGNVILSNLKNEIKLKNIYFKYLDETKYILSNLSFKIKIGKINALIGPSGSGKSTIVDLLSKIIIPNKGKILFDDVDSHNISEESLRSLISYIPQEPFLFKESILNNIKYGAPKNISNEKIWKSLYLVNMDKYIKSLPNGINTNIGLLGNTLSGGQRQRLILARAILKGSSLLILDEATSAIDAKTDNVIQKSLQKIKSNNKNITIIFISHRLTSLLFADRIIDINKGKLNFEGSYQEYLNKKK